MDKNFVDLEKIKCNDLFYEYACSVLFKAEKKLENYVQKYPSMAKRIVQIMRKDLLGFQVSDNPNVFNDRDYLHILQNIYQKVS